MLKLVETLPYENRYYLNNMKKLILFISIVSGAFFVIAYKKKQSNNYASELYKEIDTSSANPPVVRSLGKVLSKPKKSNKSLKLSKREQEIMELFSGIEEGKSLHMKDIKKQFPKVTVRTLRRDMDKLQAKRMVEKIGHTKSTRYRKL